MTRVLILALAVAAVCVAAGPDAGALLKRYDTLRNGWNSFTVRVAIQTFENGKPDEAHHFQVYQKGTDRTYVEFLSPRDKGRHLLMLGDDMWVYLPDTSRPIRITPLERLQGNASNGDIARTNWAADYEAAWLRDEKVDAANCHVLELTAKRRGATYRKIHLWLRADSSRPVKADFFLASGKHAKSATYDSYEDVQGRTVLKRMTIYDQIRKKSYSVMDYDNWKPQNLPDRMFHQGRSERF